MVRVATYCVGNEQYSQQNAIDDVLREGEIGCSRNPITQELELRIGDGVHRYGDLIPLEKK